MFESQIRPDVRLGLELVNASDTFPAGTAVGAVVAVLIAAGAWETPARWWFRPVQECGHGGVCICVSSSQCVPKLLLLLVAKALGQYVC